MAKYSENHGMGRLLLGLLAFWGAVIALGSFFLIKDVLPNDGVWRISSNMELNAALLMARSGDRLVLSPGRYRADFSLNKSVTIEGDDDPKDVWIIIPSSQSGQTIDPEVLTLRRITLAGGHIGVDLFHITGGRVDLDTVEVERCDICFFVEKATLTGKSTVFRDGGNSVQLGSGGRAEFEDCVFKARTEPAFHLDRAAAFLHLSRCQFEGGDSNAVLAEAGSITVQDSSFSGFNSYPPLYFEERAVVVVSGNTFNDIQSNALVVEAGAKAALNGNTFKNMDEPAVWMEGPGTEVQSAGNHFEGGANVPFYILGYAQISSSQDTFAGTHGLANVAEGGHLAIDRCEAHDLTYAAIIASSVDSLVVVRDSSFKGVASLGLSVESAAHIQASNNVWENFKTPVAAVRGAGSILQLTGNTFRSLEANVLIVDDNASAQLEGNEMDNRDAGPDHPAIWVSGDATVDLVKDNIILTNSESLYRETKLE